MGLAFWEQYRCRIAVSGARKPVSTVSDCKAWGQQMTRMPARVAVVATTIALVVALASPSVGATPSVATPNRSWLGDRGHYLHRGPNGETDVDVC
jgi:dTDP-4-amino-4,6-dideoxygalactose transaminase